MAFNTSGAVPKNFNPKPFKTGVSPTGESISTYQQNNNATANSTPMLNFTPKIGNNSGMLNFTPKPSTPVKSITTPDGVKTEYHPETQKNDTINTIGKNVDPGFSMGIKTPAPITGNYTLPNGTVVNTDTGATVSTPTPTYSGMVSGAVSAAQGALPLGQQAADIAKKYSGLIGNEQQNLAGQLGNIETSGTTLQTALGREGVLNRTSLARQQALAQEEQGALAGVGQQLTAQQQAQQGLQGVAGLTPEALRYGGTAGGFDLQTTISNLAKDVANGTKSPSQAESMLGNNIAFNTQLDSAIKALKPDYNRVQSEQNINAQAQALQQNVEQGRTTQMAADSANKSLDTLNQYFSKLAGVQTGGIPFTNEITQGIAKFFGSADVTAYKTALEDARTQVRSVLGTSGVTPTDAGKIVDQYLPDGMTPEILNANLAALKALMAQRVQAFTTTGNVPQVGAQNTTTNKTQVPSGEGMAEIW